MVAIRVTQGFDSRRRPPTSPPPENRGRSALLDIEDAVGAEPSSPREAVARILEWRLTEPDLLDAVHCVGSPDRYTRHLVYAGPGFSILAVVWQPGQMSPIHSHRSWCVLGVRQGALVETCFTRDGSTGLRPSRLALDSCRQLHPGSVSHSDGDDEHYHRVANLGVETAVSIHVYGVAFDQLGHGLNRIWDDQS
jgi:predicted metal-dependent enzyme (double-stranded beta helix superfamily)